MKIHNWKPDLPVLVRELKENRILDDKDIDHLANEIRKGSNIISALKSSPKEIEIWRYLAKTHGNAFMETQQEIKVFFSDLISYEQVLNTSCLPQKERGRELYVLTYNPSLERKEYENFPGRILVPQLITPTLWRTLYEYAYPKELTGKIDENQYQALCTYTLCGSTTTLNKEQNAEILAMIRGYQYIDPEIYPPDPSVQDDLTINAKAMGNCYPHHQSGGSLILMMVDPDDENAIRTARMQSQKNIVVSITTQEHIDALLKADEQRLIAEGKIA